ncbi:MAG: trigger factor [bacterium]|nr:trigger factor [bacterium]
MQSQDHNYVLKNLPKSEIELEINIPFSELEPQVKRAAILISEKINIEGFRKGKAPYEIIKNKVGEMAIYEEAAELAVRKTYPEILEEIFQKNKTDGKDFTPIGKPEITITKIAPGNDLQYKVKLALLPEVKLGDYKNIAAKTNKDKKEVVVSDEEIDKTLQWIRESRAPVVTVDRPAQKEDLVEINFETRDNGVKIADGDSKNHPLVLGKGNYLPGFEDHITGMKTGEEKTFKITAPKDWHDKNLAGKELEFKVNLKLVQERRLPELTDDFAKSLGKFVSIEELKKNIESGMRQEKEAKEKQRMRVLAIEEIAEGSKMDVPDVLIERELDKMLAELKSGIENMGMRWEDYLLQIKKKPEDLRKDWRAEAEKRVKIALVLREVAKQENIEIPEDEIKNKSDEFLRQFKTSKQASQEIDLEELRSYTMGILKNEKVFELLEKS